MGGPINCLRSIEDCVDDLDSIKPKTELLRASLRHSDFASIPADLDHIRQNSDVDVFPNIYAHERTLQLELRKIMMITRISRDWIRESSSFKYTCDKLVGFTKWKRICDPSTFFRSNVNAFSGQPVKNFDFAHVYTSFSAFDSNAFSECSLIHSIESSG